jgi:hypothetical protein
LVEVQEMIAKKTPAKSAKQKHQLRKQWLKPAAKTRKPVAKKEIKWSLILEPINTETLELIHGLTLSSWEQSCFHTKEFRFR